MYRSRGGDDLFIGQWVGMICLSVIGMGMIWWHSED